MGDKVTCSVCGESECWALADWSMGGAPGEYEEAMAKHYRLGYERSQEALAAARRECAGGSLVVGKALAGLAEQECENGIEAIGETCIASARDPANIGEPDYRFEHWCGPCIASALIALATDAETESAALAAPAAGEERKRD